MGKIIEDEKGIVEYKNNRKVSAIGSGAHIIMPKELIGKVVSIHYKRKKEGDKKK